jgi:hypothetical protein
MTTLMTTKANAGPENDVPRAAGTARRSLAARKRVGRRAEVVADCPSEQEREMLIAATYLRDIGYAPQLHRSGLHQIHDAYCVRGLAGDRVARLVANHSEAQFEVGLNGQNEDPCGVPREDSAVGRCAAVGNPPQPASNSTAYARARPAVSWVSTALGWFYLRSRSRRFDPAAGKKPALTGGFRVSQPRS